MHQTNSFIWFDIYKDIQIPHVYENFDLRKTHVKFERLLIIIKVKPLVVG